MDITAEDLRQVVCTNKDCEDVDQTYLYPVDETQCFCCKSKLKDVE